MFFLMKLLFGFCLDFCCQKIWITQASNLEITKKNYGNTVTSKTECSVGEHSTGLPGWDDLKDRVFSGRTQHRTSWMG